MDLDALEALVRAVQPFDRSDLLLLANLAIDEETGCWVWQRSTDRSGYGQTSPRRHGHTIVHRAVWERFVGPIPDGLTLDHLCRNKACSNPRHLEPVTNEENVRRAAAPAGEPLAGVAHGTRAAYTRDGCRCLRCREANRSYQQAWRTSRAV